MVLITQSFCCNTKLCEDGKSDFSLHQHLNIVCKYRSSQFLLKIVFGSHQWLTDKNIGFFKSHFAVFLSYEMKTCNDQRVYLGKKTPNFLKLIFFSANRFFML